MNKNAVLASALLVEVLVLGALAGCAKSDLTPPGAPTPEPTNMAAAVPARPPVKAGGGPPAGGPSGMNSKAVRTAPQ